MPISPQNAFIAFVLVVVAYYGHKLYYSHKNPPTTAIKKPDHPYCGMCLMEKALENSRREIESKNIIISNQALTIREMRSRIHGLKISNGMLGKEVQALAMSRDLVKP